MNSYILPTTPTDAAVREAVEHCKTALAGSVVRVLFEGAWCDVEEQHLETLLCAVQAPRLTLEQVEVLIRAEQFCGPILSTKLHAAFPEAFAGEGSREALVTGDAPKGDNGGCISWCYVDRHNVRVVATYRPLPEWSENKSKNVRDAIEAALVRADDDIQAIQREDAPEYI